MTKHTPATPLPYRVGDPTNVPPVSAEKIAAGPHRIISTGVSGYSSYDFAKAHTRKDADYIVHAANAYPKLVAAIQEDLRGYLGDFPAGHAATKLRNLLRSLGEGA